jgi:hypothetical protein
MPEKLLRTEAKTRGELNDDFSYVERQQSDKEPITNQETHPESPGMRQVLTAMWKFIAGYRQQLRSLEYTTDF